MKSSERLLKIAKAIIRNEYFQVALLLSFLIVLFFGKDLLSGESIYLQIKKDPTPFHVYYPWNKFSRDVFHSGYIPLWNPYSGLGFPLLSDFHSAILYPLKILIYLLPLKAGIEIFILVRIFIAGFFTYLFCRSINIGKTGSLLSAIAFIFCGHFMRYLNMIFLNTDICIPILLWTVNNVMDKRKISSLFLGSGVIFISIVGGHPETTLYTWLLIGCWVIFKLLFYSKIKITEQLIVCCFLLGGSIILGSLLSTLQVLPFAQYMSRAWNYHHVSPWSVHLDIKFLISLLLPWFYGNSFNSLVDTYNLIPYSGIITVTLALLTLMKIKSSNRYGVFFAGTSIFFMGLAYGLPGFKLTVYLPIIDRLFLFLRGPVAAVSFSITIMAGIGLDNLMKRQNYARAFYWSLATITLFIIIISLLHSLKLFWPTNSSYIMSQIGLAILSLTLIFILFRWYSYKRIKIFSFEILILCLTFFTLWIDNLGNKSIYQDEIEEQLNLSHTDYLKKDKEIFRFCAFPLLLLPPHFGSLYLLSDIRIADALIEKQYLSLLNSINGITEKEFAYNYSKGSISGPHQDKINSPILDLINLKYVVSRYGLLSQHIYDEISVKSKILTMNKRYFSIEENNEHLGFWMNVINQHPPTLIEFLLRIPEEGAYIHFIPRISHHVWLPEKGDGINFSLDVITGEKTEKLFHKYIDPKNNKKDRKRRRIKINLVSYRGKEVIFRLITDPGPKGNNFCDWASWEEFRLEESDPDWGYELVSEKDVKIYKNKDFFPRAFVVPEARVVEEHEEVLKIMDSGNYDLRKVIILEEEIPQLMPKNKLSIGTSKTKITDYRATKVDIEAQMDGEGGFLVLSDVYYPGWKVYVDGKEERIYRADYLLRAVYLSLGFHQVKFIYDPMSFKVGLWITFITLLCFGGYFIYSKI
ncbi:MAG: YfhO family protein [Deltaproteobacteria bacterium]|nr:MAG: YfhO family protein [Deltaproteobacteria bacterium]